MSDTNLELEARLEQWYKDIQILESLEDKWTSEEMARGFSRCINALRNSPPKGIKNDE